MNDSSVAGKVWHQYDGMINKQPDSSMWANLKFWENKEQRKREMAIATHAFLPKLETFCTDTNLMTAEQALRQIGHVRDCMKQCDETTNVSNPNFIKSLNYRSV